MRGLWNATGGFALSLVGDPVGTNVGTVEPFAYVATHLDRAPSDFMAGVDYMRSQSVSDRVEFLTTIATGVVISRKLPSIRARAPAGTIAAEGVAGAVRIHGNSASSQATSYLYRLEVATTGEYLKTGISQNPLSRYSQTFMRGKEMEILQQGSRREMLNLERFIVERDPGPLNREPWAGRLANDILGGE